MADPMDTASRIGNDVMDLMDPRCRDRARGDPIVARILTREERRALEGVSDGEQWRMVLWAHWAAKEAAYKVRSKMVDSPGPFTPRAFIAELDVTRPETGGLARIAGTVRGEGSAPSVTVSGSSDGRHVHVLAWSGLAAGPVGGHLETGLEEVGQGSIDAAALRDRFTAPEWEGVRSGPSAVVRLLARERVRTILESRRPADGANGGPAVQIVTSRVARGSTPPRIRVGDEDIPGWDVSLSHHGRYVAWALLVPA